MGEVIQPQIQSQLVRKRPRLVLVDSSLSSSTTVASSSIAAATTESTSGCMSERTAGAVNIQIRIRLGNSCQRNDREWRTWIAFVEIGPSHATWLEKVRMRFKCSGDADMLEDIPASDSPGVFLSSPRTMQQPVEIRIELHWKPELLETPRISNIAHMLDLEKDRTERTIFVAAKTRKLDISPSGDDPNHDVPRSLVQSHERLLKLFRDLFRRWLLANPQQFENNCKRLRVAVEEKHFYTGPWIILSTQAEPIIQEVAAALSAAGHTVVIPEALHCSSQVAGEVATASKPMSAMEPIQVAGEVATASDSMSLLEVAGEVATASDSTSLLELIQVRGILRTSGCPQRQIQRKKVCFRGHDCPGDMPEPIFIECYKESRSSLWYDGVGLRACCDDCGAVKRGKLHGGTPGVNSTRDQFYCVGCLHKRSLMDWEVSDMPCDTAVKLEESLLSCEKCGKSIEKAKYWHDYRLARHTYCEECYESWEQAQRHSRLSWLVST